MEFRDSGAQTVRRACAVLRVVADAGASGVRLLDISKQLGLTRSTTHRLAQALQAENLLGQKDHSQRYVLGIDLFRLAVNAGNQDNLQDAARPSLLRLSSAIGDTIFLLLRTGYEAICIDKIEGQYQIQAVTKGIGGSVPLGLVPGGLAILAFLPAAEQDEILRANMPLILNEAYPDEVSVRAALAQAKADRYALSLGVAIKGVGGLASPILDPRGRPIGAISIGGIVDRFSDNRIKAILPMLLREIEQIGQRIGLV
jgi:DNA-binding IclR family transcriptional regulator